jgi:ribonucleoside-diphosphate reductase alpha chain
MQVVDKPIAAGLSVIKRDGSVVSFDAAKIELAIKKCFVDVLKGNLSARHHELISIAVTSVSKAVSRQGASTVHIEAIQDAVELALMRSGEHQIARGYVLFREAQTKKRSVGHPTTAQINLVDGSGNSFFLDQQTLTSRLESEIGFVDVHPIVSLAMKEIFNGASELDLRRAVRLAARSMIEIDPAYDRAVSTLALNDIYVEVLGQEAALPSAVPRVLLDQYPAKIREGVIAGLLDEKLLQFDLSLLATKLDNSRDLKFESMGVQTLYDRYLVHIAKRRIETPQMLWMRVAMGLAINEVDRDTKAIEFYEVLSRFQFINSTPTLFNAGTPRPQLSSCYLTTVDDDLGAIYDCIKENALLQKYAGGLGNDWTPIRALGSHIKGTNGESQGVIPFLKVVNDTAVAVNQGGKRKGAVCAYLETWHMDIDEFLDLRKNTGDDRRRTHDMNTANWIPDLFMKRVFQGADWTLFTPSEVPHLHDLYGSAFETAYISAERLADSGQIKNFRRVKASDLWRKMLSMLYETGHPWITFKDPCNIRSPQQHVGVVHSSNLCTEITLNTSAEETAVCNIGSVNLMEHIDVATGGLDPLKIRKTVKTAMRMLDNVIDINLYPTVKARKSNLRHRPVGIGIMGFHDALIAINVPYASDRAVECADVWQEMVCFEAYSASCDLAEERGRYSSFKGSLWDRGIFPHQSQHLVAEQRGNEYLVVDDTARLNWADLMKRIQIFGMRNSNCAAIAPTATIANIVAVSQSIDPHLTNLFVKSSMSGEFTKVNPVLVEKLKKIGAWDSVMLADLKHFEGSVAHVERVPQAIAELFKTAFEIEPSWLILAAAKRQKWIDQAQSLNLYLAKPSGKALDEMYRLAWTRGLKTTYYLRVNSAKSAEKSTGRVGSHNSVSIGNEALAADPEGKFCSLRPGDTGFAECEACQ